MKKIVNNLYLGDKDSITSDSDLVISCAKELYEINTNDNNDIFWKDEKHVFYNFEDYPEYRTMDKSIIFDAVLKIEENIKSKKIYVHCLFGINRSASVVFMFMVRNNHVSNKDFKTSLKEFKQIYPNHHPNPGWYNFLEREFPYNF